jgi:hypothetical protein|tara:strand:+ start:1788 stop:2138 length:351 start_codon:yes stop_codon:yes gene_type:complete
MAFITNVVAEKFIPNDMGVISIRRTDLDQLVGKGGLHAYKGYKSCTSNGYKCILSERLINLEKRANFIAIPGKQFKIDGGNSATFDMSEVYEMEPKSRLTKDVVILKRVYENIRLF